MQSASNDVIDLTHFVDPEAMASLSAGAAAAEEYVTMGGAVADGLAEAEAAAIAAVASVAPEEGAAMEAPAANVEEDEEQAGTEPEEEESEDVALSRLHPREGVGSSAAICHSFQELGTGPETFDVSALEHALRGSAPLPAAGVLSDSTNVSRRSLPPPPASCTKAGAKANSGSTGEDRSGASKGKKRKRRASESSKAPDAEDGERCSICLDPWTSKGKHRICTLLCGHLFGQSCIERWLKERRSCPQCGAKVGAKGTNRIIPLFLQNLVAKDTGELETARSLLEEEKRLRKQCEAERVRLSIDNASLKDQLSRLTQTKNQTGRGGGGTGGQYSERRRGTLPASPWPSAGPLAMGEQRASVFSPRERCPVPPVPAGGAPQDENGVEGNHSVSGSSNSCSRASSGLALTHPGATAYSQFHRSPLPRPRASGGASLGYPRSDSSGSRGGDRSGSGSSSTGSSATVVRASEWASWGRAAAAEDVVEVCAAAVDERDTVRFEHLLSRDVASGRVASFAGGAAGALLVSQEFGGARGSRMHGVTKFSLADLRHHKNINMHRQQVRDIKFSANGGSVGYLLSTSFDKTLKVCDLRTDSIVVEYGLEGNGWSCQWSTTTPNQMFCGVVDGTRTSAIQLFDLRSTAGAVRKLRAAARQRQPVHSICHTADDVLLCATMGGVWAWGGGTKGAGGVGEGEEEHMAQQLQIQTGACCSLSQSSTAAAAAAAAAAATGSNGSFSPQSFLVSTRGASASHAVYDLHPSSAPSPRAPAAARVGTAVGSRRDTTTASEAGDSHEAAETREGTRDAAVAVAAAEGGSVATEMMVDAAGSARSVLGSRARAAEEVVPPVVPVERRTWAERWSRSPRIAQGHQSQNTLSRSLLWEPSSGGELLIAGGDERTNQPWMWKASTGSVCIRLASHRSPVLDMAALQDHATGRGLFVAVGQTEMKLYNTCVR